MTYLDVRLSVSKSEIGYTYLFFLVIIWVRCSWGKKMLYPQWLQQKILNTCILKFYFYNYKFKVPIANAIYIPSLYLQLEIEPYLSAIQCFKNIVEIIILFYVDEFHSSEVVLISSRGYCFYLVTFY